MRWMRLVARVSLSAWAAVACAAGTASALEPEPEPCRDVIVRPVRAAAMCLAPTPDYRLSALAGAAGGAGTWFGLGVVGRRLYSVDGRPPARVVRKSFR